MTPGALSIPPSARLLPLLCLLLAAFACSTPPAIDETGDWAEVVVEEAPPQRDLLSAAEYAVVRAGFPPGERDEARGTVVSGWDLNLQPFRNQGARWRGIIKVERVEGGTRLAARVQHQRNTEKDDTLDPGAAEWEDLADDRGRARVLLQQFLSQLHLSS